ncbi:MarR family winged helix-turn-helix transcriptional regulator [Agromyces kandeliae]|uniref:MarR family transcriptional regulator n=1 Tax=Agromyces kandeliae TaxID=2666141 RepID=A0A6L5R1B0_9MICO|nr:MarR family winged helix-turn-helix transcriptional regulator [Agromyces kandeliae]MRX43645.1 MarR family transcriptional regulator [Agromyces kandeliae]
MGEEDGANGRGDAVDRIEQALASLRRGGRPSWGGVPHGHGGGHAHGPDEPHRHGGPFGRGGPGGRGGPRGPWEFRVGPVARARLLAMLDAADRPMSVTELAGAIGVDQPRASRLVQAAVEEGLVVREADPEDARRTRIRITEEGREAVHAANSTRRRAIESALEGFSDEDRARFADLLGRFADGLRRAHPPHS